MIPCGGGPVVVVPWWWSVVVVCGGGPRLGVRCWWRGLQLAIGMQKSQARKDPDEELKKTLQTWTKAA